MPSAHPTKEDSKPERNTGNFDLHMAKKINYIMLKRKLLQLQKNSFQ
jgi:hypothetical protein